MEHDTGVDRDGDAALVLFFFRCGSGGDATAGLAEAMDCMVCKDDAPPAELEPGEPLNKVSGEAADGDSEDDLPDPEDIIWTGFDLHRRTCLLRLDATPKRRPHVSQTNAFSPVCTSRCFLRVLGRSNRL